jgi:hypothetical protein
MLTGDISYSPEYEEFIDNYNEAELADMLREDCPQIYSKKQSLF